MESKEEEKKKVRHQTAKNKSLGYSIEREYAIIFREMGFDKCKTTRNTSRLLDSCKVDLNFLPILLQLKAGFQKGMSVTGILKEMETLLTEHYPDYDPIHDLPRAVVHHKPKPKGVRERTEYDVMVHMTFKNFKKLLMGYHKNAQNDLQNKKRTD